jgi:hypothetical protein
MAETASLIVWIVIIAFCAVMAAHSLLRRGS